MQGSALAAGSGSAACCRECAAILEGLKQWQEAARLYELPLPQLGALADRRRRLAKGLPDGRDDCGPGWRASRPPCMGPDGIPSQG